MVFCYSTAVGTIMSSVFMMIDKLKGWFTQAVFTTSVHAPSAWATKFYTRVHDCSICVREHGPCSQAVHEPCHAMINIEQTNWTNLNLLHLCQL